MQFTIRHIQSTNKGKNIYYEHNMHPYVLKFKCAILYLLFYAFAVITVAIAGKWLTIQ